MPAVQQDTILSIAGSSAVETNLAGIVRSQRDVLGLCGSETGDSGQRGRGKHTQHVLCAAGNL